MTFQIAKISLRSNVFVGFSSAQQIPNPISRRRGFIPCQRGFIPWKMIHRGSRKNYKEHFLF